MVTLADGREVHSNSEAWRIESLACELLAKPLEARREWLAAHEKRHGAAAVAPLKAAMTLLHKVRA